MGQHCCAEHIKDRKNREDLFYRNIIVLATGLLLQFHDIEHLLFHGDFAVASFLLLSAMVLNVLVQDFEHINMKTHLRRAAIVCVIWGIIQPVLGISHLAAMICIVSVIILKQTLSWLKAESHHRPYSIIGALRHYTDSALSKLYRMDWIPSMETIVLVSIFVTWGASAMVIMNPMLHAEILMHDTLMQLSVYNLGRWLRSHFDASSFFHNHTTSVYVEVDHGRIKKKINELKKGDIVILESGSEHKDGVFLPVSVQILTGKSVYRDCQSEKKIKCEISEDDVDKVKLAAHHKVFEGRYLCLERYETHRTKDNKQARKEHEQKDEIGTRFFLFMMYCTAFISSITTAMHVGFIIGIEKLCLTLMVACPCVYMVIRPAALSKICNLVPRIGFLMNTESLPLVNKRKTIIFDRTGTLWHENDEDREGAYVISEEAKLMLKKLIKQGVDIKILSGHSTGSWEKHLSSTRNLLKELGVKDVECNVIFDQSLHGEDSLKGRYISNLKRYNHYGLNPTWKEKLWGWLYNIYSPQTIIMVGDDINDKAAMKAADISIAVGQVFTNAKEKSNAHVAFNDEVGTYAHFLTSKNKIQFLYKMIMMLDRTSLWIRGLTLLSGAFGMGLMSIVSGILQLQISINPAFVCMFTTSYCFAITLVSRSKLLDNTLENILTEDSSKVRPWVSIMNSVKKKFLSNINTLKDQISNKYDELMMHIKKYILTENTNHLIRANLEKIPGHRLKKKYKFSDCSSKTSEKSEEDLNSRKDYFEGLTS